MHWRVSHFERLQAWYVHFLKNFLTQVFKFLLTFHIIFPSGQSFNFEGVPSDFVSIIPSFFSAQAWSACDYQQHDRDLLVQVLFFLHFIELFDTMAQYSLGISISLRLWHLR